MSGAETNVVSRIVNEPSPVLFLDACSILDVIRGFFRPILQVGIAEAAVEIIDRSSSPRRVWAVTTSLVLDEYRKNRPAVEDELLRSVEQINASVARYASFGRISSPDRQVHTLSWLDADFRERILTMLDRFVDSLLVCRGTSGCLAKAHQRVLTGLPPATRSSEYKDCFIFEEFLEFGLSLRQAGFDGPIVFVTFNSNDYGKPPSGHDQIGADLASIQASYVSNIAWAVASIGVRNAATSAHNPTASSIA